ncbi:MAG: zinc ABC transporter substrate-binding protein [Geobacteraceae bacterium]|nr:zinc ABC transporter substrate-binding protein [Geobacteraceae bacterium]
MKILIYKLLLFLLILTLLSACSKKTSPPDTGKLKVVTTLFPIYDFARAIGGDAADVTLLLPPGVEPHSFEPKPEDMMKIAKADIFIYTSSEMEPWAEKLASGVVKNGKPLKVEAGAGARYLAASGQDEHGHKEGGRDPHIWLDMDNAALMMDNIARALAERLPQKAQTFRSNAASGKEKLKTLDIRFKTELSNCSTREFIHGGHFAFAYLADRYKLNYISAYGVSADSEPSPKKMMALIEAIRRHKLKSIFYEELLSPAVAQTVASETGATLLKLHGIHNLTKEEIDSGVSFTALMEQNLVALKKGLVCQ